MSHQGNGIALAVCALIVCAAGWAQDAEQKPAVAPEGSAQTAEKSSAQQPSAPVEHKAEPAVKEGSAPAAADTESKALPAGSKVFIAPMPIGFHALLRDAIRKKKVPLQIVEDRSQADFEITGTAESQKAGAAKILIMGSWHSRESASIQVANLKSGIVVYAYSYHHDNSAHGPRSSAESCAKHLKNKIEGKEE